MNTIDIGSKIKKLRSKKSIEIGKKYKHYKGGEYKVLNISRHTEQDEELVNYHKIGESEIWSRPKGMFMDGRFQPIN